MHKHILISTDGSDLSEKAIDYGMALAKSVNAKVTVITVSAPFHGLVIKPTLYTLEQHDEYTKTVAAKYLDYHLLWLYTSRSQIAPLYSVGSAIVTGGMI